MAARPARRGRRGRRRRRGRRWRGRRRGGAGRPDRRCDAAETCGDDLDNNCDGLVDEGCTCTVPEKPCYSGDPRDLEARDGQCRQGVQACRLEFYGPCEGEVLPTAEVCDGIDNDCNGRVDDLPGCDNAPPTAICPPDQQGPPLADYSFVGGYADPDGDRMVRATWRMVQQPGGSTSTPNPSNQLSTRIFADLLGEYTLELEVEDENGGIGRCTTNLTTITSDGLRIEMVWNVNARGDTSDVDMHLLRAPGAQWFEDGGRGDDCFFRNCRVCDSYDEAACRQQLAQFNNSGRTPPAQVEWTAPLDADDPRLDLDDVEGNGPENINIQAPRAGTYRLGVHYWEDDGFGASSVTVRIFCGGELAREFEPLVMQPGGDNGGPTTEFWEVADIVWSGAGCEVRERGPFECPRICTRGEVESLGECPAGMTRGRRCG
ncbi:MAG: hypothetical protein H6706_04200 [Myxococcales bacterium]|nr:hypothetical protein [Myxococcales bacterium]